MTDMIWKARPNTCVPAAEPGEVTYVLSVDNNDVAYMTMPEEAWQDFANRMGLVEGQDGVWRMEKTVDEIERLRDDIIARAILYEVANGTQRSVGALYGFVILSMRNGMEKIIPINQAIRKQWPGKDEGWESLDRIKKIGWDVSKAALEEDSES